MAEHETHDERARVAIVGGGPIGVELAATLARDGVDFVHVEARQLGHTMTWWAPGTRWFSSNERIAVAGVPLLTHDQGKATREHYLTYLRTVVGTHDLTVRTYEPAVDVERHGDGTFTLVTNPRGGRRRIACEAVVLAVGGTDFPRKLGCEGDDLPHVDGYLRDPHDYFGRRVLTVGGRNSAVEAALRLHHAGAEVALSYRGPDLDDNGIKYWLLPEINGLTKSGRVEGHFDTVPDRITPTHVTLRNLKTGDRYDVEADAVLSLIGYEQDKRLFRRAGVDLVGETQRPAFDEATMETNVPALYVAGTAVAGTQSSSYKIFLENCHVHCARIAAHLRGDAPPAESEDKFHGRGTPLGELVAAHPES